jgi:hypothetical protein
VSRARLDLCFLGSCLRMSIVPSPFGIHYSGSLSLFRPRRPKPFSPDSKVQLGLKGGNKAKVASLLVIDTSRFLIVGHSNFLGESKPPHV